MDLLFPHGFKYPPDFHIPTPTGEPLFHIGPLTVGWETGDVTRFPDRWKWISTDMLPRYKQLLENPRLAEQGDR